MRRWFAGLAAVAALCLAIFPVAAAPAAPIRAASGAPVAASGGTWGRAIQVPGTVALSAGRGAGMGSVSCASPGNCSGGGSYTAASAVTHAFVVSQVHGTWRKAERVPGALTARGNSAIAAVSCASPGDCSAGGPYARGVFVVSQVNGTWGQARPVVGRALLPGAEIRAVSCGSAGNCSAGGYTDDPLFVFPVQAWVAGQVHGTWGKARVVPGLAALSDAGDGLAGINSLSCASAGSCTAAGQYQDGHERQQAFVVSQRKGTWGKAIEAPGTAVLNQGGDAAISAVSCASAGNCSAGGFYTDASGAIQAFVVRQVGGAWRPARRVLGLVALNAGADAEIRSVSCASAGNCTAAGYYRDSSGTLHPFVVSQVNGKWRTASQVPGLTALAGGREAEISSVSCGSVGNCSAVGLYGDPSGDRFDLQVFVVSQVNGTWRPAEELPSVAALNKGEDAGFGLVSCAAVGECSAGGSYTGGSFVLHAFVVTES